MSSKLGSLAIRLERVSKRYRAGRSRTMVDLLSSKFGRFERRPSQVYSLTKGRIDADIWALRDISVEVPEGEGLGVIGPNGAGKTTLLKLISRVTWPTEGRVHVGGRVVSLIELGAGFHPELTGRENIYLGGGLFGLSRRQLDAKFDRIVQFAEVERLIDTPMKRYASGLYARLGFSVAIHSDPDIVLVDEVLAVGDAAFRRRALDSLRQLIADGKTVLFISHDMWNVRRLCDRILWLDEGRVRAYGPAAAIAERYMSEVNLDALANHRTALQSHRGGTGEIRYTEVGILDSAGRETNVVRPGDPLSVRAGYQALKPVDRPVFQIGVVDVDTGLLITSATSSPHDLPDRVEGSGYVHCVFESLPLRPRQCVLRLSITDSHQLVSYDVVTNGPRFAVAPEPAASGRPDSLSAVPRVTEDDDGMISLPYRFEHRAQATTGKGAR